SADDPSTDGATGDEARAYVNEVELNADEVFSLAPNEVDSVAPGEYDSDLPDDSAVETEPPDETDDEPETSIEEVEDDYMDEDEPSTVVAAVDAEAMMADAEEAHEEEVHEAEVDDEEVDDEDSQEKKGQHDVITNEDETPDPDYAFEHGIAPAPQVGMPVPIPSMAAPPEAPPAPPRLRLADPPDGLTRPSLAKSEELGFSTDGEISDVHTTGLFAYEEGLPIPSRPPLPDSNRVRSAAADEAPSDSDVEESEPPESHDDEYEEVRLSDFAGAVEEG
ncbi:MAG: hypothetical protein KJN97_06450, partial [Deltaproteobacteria bacterium]|nr:hypothetical protein [Deltaproteobacteria bacterium]